MQIDNGKIESRMRSSLNKREKNIYYNFHMVRATLSSIYYQKHIKDEKQLKNKSDYFIDDNNAQCPLIPNGTWAHIPSEWLSKMATIIDLVNKAILHNDIKILHKLQESYMNLYNNMSHLVPLNLRKKNSISTLKMLNKLNTTEEYTENIVSFAEKFNKRVSYAEQKKINLIEKSSLVEKWFIPKSSDTTPYSDKADVTHFKVLLDLLSSLPTNSRMFLSQVGTTGTNHTGVAMDDDVSDSLTVMALITAKGKTMENDTFNKLLDHSQGSDGVSNSKDDEYDDSDYKEFNIKYIQPSHSKELNEDKLQDFKNEIEIVYSSDPLIELQKTFTDLFRHSSEKVDKKKEIIKEENENDDLKKLNENLNDGFLNNIEKLELLEKINDLNKSSKLIPKINIIKNKETLLKRTNKSELNLKKTLLKPISLKEMCKCKKTYPLKKNNICIGKSNTKINIEKKKIRSISKIKKEKTLQLYEKYQNNINKQIIYKKNVKKSQMTIQKDCMKLMIRRFPIRIFDNLTNTTPSLISPVKNLIYEKKIQKENIKPNKERNISLSNLKENIRKSRLKKYGNKDVNKNVSVKTKIKKPIIIFNHEQEKDSHFNGIKTIKSQNKIREEWKKRIEKKFEEKNQKIQTKMKLNKNVIQTPKKCFNKKEKEFNSPNIIQLKEKLREKLKEKKRKYFHLYHPKIIQSIKMSNKIEEIDKFNINIINKKLTSLEKVYRNIEKKIQSKKKE